jgi:class 3 adenylate cyclase
MLYDKFDDVYLAEDVLAQFARQARGTPITYDAGRLEPGGAPEYIKSRKQVIRESFVDGAEHSPNRFADKGEEFLEALAGNELGFAILSLDVVGSTALATSLGSREYRSLLSASLFEWSEAVPLFNGHVLKYTGDGLIAYFAEPSFMRKMDLAIDCALTLRGLLHDALNLVFREQGLPSLAIRVGIDAGEAFVDVVGSPQTKRHADLVGDVVSLASKIQAQAPPDQIFLGASVVQNLHVSWREKCELVEVPDDWPYETKDGAPYRFYRYATGQRYTSAG